MDYITYLSIFDHLFDIPRERKNSEYRNYIRVLLTYLKDFVNRVKPLQDQAQEMAAAHQEFTKQWEAGTFPGWPVRYPSQNIIETILFLLNFTYLLS